MRNRITEKRIRDEQEKQISDDFKMEFQACYLGRYFRDDWKREVDDYSVSFRNYLTNKTFTIKFSSGVGHRNNGALIKPFDVLYCISAEDTNGETFESWCFEYGYNTDSRKALETYLLCQKQSDDFKKVFPNIDLHSYEPLENY